VVDPYSESTNDVVAVSLYYWWRNTHGSVLEKNCNASCFTVVKIENRAKVYDFEQWIAVTMVGAGPRLLIVLQ